MNPSLKSSNDLQQDHFESIHDESAVYQLNQREFSQSVTDDEIESTPTVPTNYQAGTHSQQMSVCMQLQKQRQQLGLNLDKVAIDLRISKAYLTAIENADVNELPERVYTLGFIRSYAHYLNLEPFDIIHRFKLEVLGDTINPHYTMPKPVKGNALPNRGLIWLTCTVVVIGAVAGWVYYALDTPTLTKSHSIPIVIRGDIDRHTDENNQAPSSTSPTVRSSAQTQRSSQYPINTATTTSSTAPVHEEPLKLSQLAQQSLDDGQFDIDNSLDQHQKTGAKLLPLPALGHIQLRFTALSWVEIRDEYGTTIINRNFKPGDYYDIQPKSNLMFSTGNAGGIDIVLPSNHAFNLGKAGEVLHNISLTSNRFQPPF